MKSSLYCLFAIAIFCSCSNTSNHSYKSIVNSDKERDSLAIELPVDLPKELNISAYISDFRYVPLETNTNSLLGECRRMEVYKDRIYILDGIISPSVFIFDLNGRFITKAGKRGNGPGELTSAAFMAIDVYHDYLLLGDTSQNKIVYFSLDGQFRKELFCSIGSMVDFSVIGRNCLGFASGEAFNNPLPDHLSGCRIITTDTLGNITGGILQQEDLATFCVQTSCFFRKDTVCFFSPLFTSDIYAVTDSSVTLKYKCDYHFIPKKMEPPENMDNFLEAARYMDMKTSLCGVFLDGPSSIAFQTKHDKKDFTTFYDKETRKSITVATHPYYTTDDSCLVAFNWLTTVDDYYVGYIAAGDLIFWNNLRKKEGKNSLYPNLFASLGEDDNMVLVFFKLKSIL